MKRFIFILLASFLLADGRKLSNWANDKENFPSDLDEIGSRQNCNTNEDCGESGCCFSWTMQCYSKPKHNESCSPEKSSCPCMPGLACGKYKDYDGQKFYRCMKPEEFLNN
ncbi:hypothetical protein ACROYT_G008912 [Oculina patagonica]